MESCLVKKFDGAQMIVVGIYVDDVLMVGNEAGINNEVKKIMSRFGVRRTEEVNEYVGCQLHFVNENETKRFRGKQVEE